MITSPQQRKHCCANCSHTGAKANRSYALLHGGNFVFERTHGGVYLTPVGVAGLCTLEYCRQLVCVVKSERDRVVNRFVYGAVFYGILPITMYKFAGKSFHISLRCSCCKPSHG